ncbi:MAG: CsbD family protein [Caldilineaceae bacterium]|nr:CsbD family protein [Caldilineaceae bacterium]
MNQITWQGKLRQWRGEFKREWGKFTNNDRQRVEGELDRLLGQMQQKYGYTREHAWKELERYWHDYRKPMQAAVNATVNATLGKPHQAKSFRQRVPWLTLLVAAVAVVIGVAQLRWPEEEAEDREFEQKRKEAIRQEKERDHVDERSWESFPASDPPASW